MKRFVSRLVPLLLPACMVDTPVVESPDSGVGSDRLGENLGEWCDWLCARFDACDEADEECVTQCVELFRDGFANKNVTCTEAGLRTMDCVEQASCAELTGIGLCSFQEELELCFASQGLVYCSDEASNPSPGRGGVFSCSVDLEGCSNGSVYRLACDGPGDPPECSCTVDDEVVGRFVPSWLSCPDVREVARICGWPVSDGTRSPTYPPVEYCNNSSMSDVSGGDCSASFAKCSNGHSYAIECQDGSPGVVDCTCFLDGEEYDTYQSVAGVCPFVRDLDDGGIVATNYACGFNLLSVPPPK